MGSKTLSLFSWAMYDFANTIFSAIVLTAYFPLYLTEKAGSNWSLGFATTTSMVLAGLVLPVLGALSDQTGKSLRYLIYFTAGSVISLFGLSWAQSPAALIFFFMVSCFFYHAALVFYNSLLCVAVPPKQQGFASGLGTGLGYFGVVAALPFANWVDGHFGRPAVFSLAAVLFFLFSLPTFFFVPERSVTNPIRFRWSLWQSEWQKVFELVRKLPSQPSLLLFLGGNFFVVDALNTMIFWFLVFAREVFHPAQKDLILLLMAVNGSAFLAGLITGVLTDRWGAMKTFIFSAVCLAAALIGLSRMPDFKSFIFLSLTGGAFSIAGIWTAGRKALLDIAPLDKVGEYFGIYGLTTKISVIGNFAFSIVADLAGFRTALLVLVFPAVVGCAFLIWSAKLNRRGNS